MAPVFGRERRRKRVCVFSRNFLSANMGKRRVVKGSIFGKVHRTYQKCFPLKRRKRRRESDLQFEIVFVQDTGGGGGGKGKLERRVHCVPLLSKIGVTSWP